MVTTAVDTNVLSTLLNATEKDTQRARTALLLQHPRKVC